MTSGSRILLVEDEPELREDLAAELRDLGYRVDEVGDGISALEWLLKAPCDLVVCDVRLPGLGGLELLAELRLGSHTNRDVPFVFTTAYAEETLRRQAAALGRAHYLVKPVDFDRLFSLIEELAGSDRSRC